MTGDPVKSVPLPSGPASLCFEKDDFMKENFNVDEFVLECRRRVQLEDLRDDLSVYLKILRSSMIELINKDYADFVNLSSNLVGMDKAIGSLTAPLEQLKDEVWSVRTSMDNAIAAVEEKLKKRQQIKEKKACLQRLMSIIQSVEKIERLLGIQSSDSGTEAQQFNRQLNGQLIERVATEFNKLQFYVTKSKGLPLVEKIKPRIANITTTLQYSLEGSFLEGLNTGNADILRQCLRTYALIDKIRDAENLFRQHIVRPYMEEVISEHFIKSNHDGLQGMFNKIIQFIPMKCKLLADVTSGAAVGGSEVVRGYDFLVNSVWPEVVGNIEAKTSSMFAPGNPDIFHAKYLISMQFLDQFEKQCGSQASVKRLRDHPSYHTFLNKWSLPVYFQISGAGKFCPAHGQLTRNVKSDVRTLNCRRDVTNLPPGKVLNDVRRRFQEIAGAFESSLFSAFNRAAGQSEFHLHSTQCLWSSLHRCWDDEIYLKPLCHRFWKLCVQMLMRYSTWFDEAYKEQIIDRNELPEQKQNKTQDKPVNTMNSLPPGGQIDGRLTPTKQDGRVTPTTPQTPPITVGQILSLIADAEKLITYMNELLQNTILPRFQGLDPETLNSFSVCMEECCSSIQSKLPQYREFIVIDITNQCSVHLKQVNDIPRLYRRTNREVPSKPSGYIGSVVKPLTLFMEEHSEVLGEQQKAAIFLHVFSSLAEQFHTVTSDVLTAVKKMEDSLKRLKKGRSAEKERSQGMSDDDKIRQQLIVDISFYGDQISSFGVDREEVDNYKKLLDLVEEAKSSMTSQAS